MRSNCISRASQSSNSIARSRPPAYRAPPAWHRWDSAPDRETTRQAAMGWASACSFTVASAVQNAARHRRAMAATVPHSGKHGRHIGTRTARLRERTHQPDIGSWECVRLPQSPHRDILRGPFTNTPQRAPSCNRILKRLAWTEQARASAAAVDTDASASARADGMPSWRMSDAANFAGDGNVWVRRSSPDDASGSPHVATSFAASLRAATTVIC